jgi:RecB family exonuclease
VDWPADRIPLDSLRRLSVTGWLEGSPRASEDDEGRGGSGALAGTLVHRLFQASSGGLLPASEARVRLETLLRPEERAVTPDIPAVLASALAMWDRLLERKDLQALFEGADVLAEVPFSLRDTVDGEPALLRGTIDCVALAANGAVTVLEFKTGARRDVHERQLLVYVRAVRALFPGRPVEGLLVYA